MLLTGSPGSSVNNIIHVHVHITALYYDDYEHRVLYPRGPLLTHPAPTRHASWLVV
jgi:hypothetical protein